MTDMTISYEQFKNIASMLIGLPNGENPVPAVRASFPELAISRCDADDMREETPFCRAGDFDVYLVDTSNLCWKIIAEPTAATGLILAARN
jgi:hypothetical protein